MLLLLLQLPRVARENREIVVFLLLKNCRVGLQLLL
jgi:hypothetical protein